MHSGSIVDSLNDCMTKYCLWFEEHHWLKKSNKSDPDPNTIESRLARAAQVLCDMDSDGERMGTSSANFCVSLDRGYGHVEAQERLASIGIYSNAMLAYRTRAGVPRNFLKELDKDLADCGEEMVNGKWGKCTHGANAPNCRRFYFTALHKKAKDPSLQGAAGADWDLAAWQDGTLIVSLTNFFSSSRCGFLARGSHTSSHRHSVWVPEPIWHYNLLGRSATDGSDQLRKKMCIA